MGIDIYARWEGQAPEELSRQAEAWLAGQAGDVGYLREAYHGEPYATKYLVAEAFECAEGAAIPAAVLRERLPETLRLAEVRARTLYGVTQIEATLESFRAFVELCERVERDMGGPVRIIASW
jgi:hypothetical protein